MPNSEQHVHVRYTGTRPGSARYTAPGTERKGYAFGMNPTHFQQVMPYNQYEALKKLYPKELLLIPDDMAHREIGLSDRVTQCDALLQEDRDGLFSAGLVTVGEVMALGSEGLGRIFGTDQARTDAVLAALYERYLGGPQSQKIEILIERDDLTPLPRIGGATQVALNGMGIKTFADIAEKLTLDQWLSLAGKTEAGYLSIVDSAKQRIGQN